jgi:hypothetical protein
MGANIGVSLRLSPSRRRPFIVPRGGWWSEEAPGELENTTLER